jgi:hypothetical protein
MDTSAKFARKKLYRTITLCATAALLLLTLPAHAQSKKRKGPRAIAVVRWDADAKDRAVPVLLPVAILDEGKFYDAGVYKAAPSPMSLLVGTVYEAQDKGELLGYFTIKAQSRYAEKMNWVALGDWESASPPMDKLASSADNSKSHVEVVRGKLGDQPEQTGGDHNDDRDLNKKKTTVYDENGKPMPEGTTASPAAPMGGAGDTRPTLKKSTGSTPTDSSKPADSASKPADKKPTDDPDRPTIKRQSSTTTPDSSKTPTQTSGDTTNASKPATQSTADSSASADKPPETIISAEKDPNRPQLKRGKPTTQTPGGLPHAVDDSDHPIIRRSKAKNTDPAKEQTIPVPARVLARGPLLGEGGTDAPALRSVRTYETVAVSDATVDPPTNFRYKMTADERDRLEAKMNALAQGEVDNYLKSIGRPRAGAATPAAKVKAPIRKATKPPAEVPQKSLFTETQFEVMDLDHRNEPTLIFSARERFEPKSDSASPTPQDVYVVYIAHLDYEGSPRGVFRSVTVNDRLDVTPKLELIDAIDANGDSMGELLFRRVKDGGAEFAIYRVTYDGLTEMFHGGVAD